MTLRKLPWTILAVAATLLLAIGLALTSKHFVEASLSANSGSQSSPALYVDCVHGRDDNPGTRAAPYRSLAKINGKSLGAGVTVRLAAGCAWPGPLRVAGNGTAERPVIITSYGAGQLPVITGKGLPLSQPAVAVSGTGFHITGIRVSGVQGIGINVMASGTVLSQDQIDHAGIGVQIQSPHVLVTGVRVDDLHMMANSPGGDNNYGAVGFDVEAPDAQIAYSSCDNCRAPSDDYGYDGGFVEIWNNGNDLFVHDNSSSNTNGFLEIGGNSLSGSAQQVVVERNVMTQVHGGFWVHTRGRFALPVSSVLFAYNTLVDDARDGNQVIGGGVGSLTFENNAIYSRDQVSWSGAPLVHRDNVYYVSGASAIGFPIDASERILPLSAWPTSLPAPQ
jgi:hypothetical protein